MKLFAFVLPDSLDDKDLANCIFDMKINGSEGQLSIDMIDKSGKFVRETAKVRELIYTRTKNTSSNEEVV